MLDRMHPAQIRGARGMLNWSMLDLAKAAKVSVSTVKRMEMDGPQSVSDEIHVAVRAALVATGVHFLADSGEGIGVRLQPT